MNCASNAVDIVLSWIVTNCVLTIFQFEKLGLYGCVGVICHAQCATRATRATHLSDLSLAFLLRPKGSGYMHFGAIVFKVNIINRYF